MNNNVQWFGEQFKTLIAERADTVTERAATAAMEKAKELVPVKTGALRDSIQVTKIGDGNYLMGSDLSYALDVEIGDETKPAAAFLRNSIMAYEMSKLFDFGD